MENDILNWKHQLNNSFKKQKLSCSIKNNKNKKVHIIKAEDKIISKVRKIYIILVVEEDPAQVHLNIEEVGINMVVLKKIIGVGKTNIKVIKLIMGLI